LSGVAVGVRLPLKGNRVEKLDMIEKLKFALE
jgi:hypothetical protein